MKIQAVSFFCMRVVFFLTLMFFFHVRLDEEGGLRRGVDRGLFQGENIHVMHQALNGWTVDVSMKKVAVRNRKVGIFRVGGLPSLEVEGLSVLLEQKRELSEAETAGPALLTKQSDGLQLTGVLRDAAFPGIQDISLKGLFVRGVLVVMRRAEKEVLRMTADFLETGKRGLLMRQNVSIEMQDHSLEGDVIGLDLKGKRVCPEGDACVRLPF